MSENTNTQGTFSQTNGLSVDDAEKLFAEMYGKSVDEVKSIGVQSSEPSDPPQNTEQEPQTPAKEEPSTPDPAPEAAAEPTPKDPENKPANNSNPDPYAWVDSIQDEEVKAKIVETIRARNEAEHRFRSAQGRVNALTQETLNLSKKLSSVKLKAPEKPAANLDAAPRTAKEWEALIQSDPDLAKAIEAHVESRLSEVKQTVHKQVDTLKETAIDPLYEHQARQHMAREMELLEQRVPNYVEVINSPEYTYWLNNLPQNVRMAVTSINNHAEAEKALHMFATDMVAWGWDKASPFRQRAVPQVQQPSAHVQASNPAPSAEAEKLRKERESKLNAPAVVSSRPNLAPANPAAADGPVTLEEAERIYQEAYRKLKNKTN